jgi:magnesium transporter
VKGWARENPQGFRSRRDGARRDNRFKCARRVSDVRGSLVSAERVLLFIRPDYETDSRPTQFRDDVRLTLRDLQSIEEYAAFRTQKVQFLLDTDLRLSPGLGLHRIVVHPALSHFPLETLALTPGTPKIS